MSYYSRVFGVVDAFNPPKFEHSLSVFKFFFLLLVLFNFSLQHLSDGLISRWKEVVRQDYLFGFGNLRVMIDGWVKVEQKGQLKGLVRVQKLVFEAEALDFVEVEGQFFGVDLVDGYASDWSV